MSRRTGGNGGNDDSARSLHEQLADPNKKNVESTQQARAESFAEFAERSFPTNGAFGKAAEAWTPGVFPVTPGHTLESLSFGQASGAFQAGMDMELARLAYGNGQMNLARTAFQQAQENAATVQPTPPTQVAVGTSIKVVPNSVFDAPRRLHEHHNEQAGDLFDKFCKGKKQLVMKLAAKAGHPSMPFLFLTQALWELLDFQRFAIDGSNCPEHCRFSPELERNPRGEVQSYLRLWAGDELAELITERCERAQVSIRSGLKQMYLKLDANRERDITTAKQYQTTLQWAAQGDEDDDEEF